MENVVISSVVATPDGRVSRHEAAKFLGFKPKTLAEWHSKGIGPRSQLVGGRRFYTVQDLTSFVASGR